MDFKIFFDCCFLLTEKSGSVSGDSGHCSHHTDAYDELFKTPSLADLDPLDHSEEETANKVEVYALLVCRPGRDASKLDETEHAAEYIVKSYLLLCLKMCCFYSL